MAGAGQYPNISALHNQFTGPESYFNYFKTFIYSFLLLNLIYKLKSTKNNYFKAVQRKN